MTPECSMQGRWRIKMVRCVCKGDLREAIVRPEGEGRGKTRGEAHASETRETLGFGLVEWMGLAPFDSTRI